jgi:hypothetical protein
LYCTQGPLCHITIHKWRLTLSVSFHVISWGWIPPPE